MVLHDVHLREDGGIGKCVPVEFNESGDVLFCGSMVNLGVLLKYLKQLPVCLIAELVTTLELYLLWHLTKSSNVLVNVVLTSSDCPFTMRLLATFITFWHNTLMLLDCI